MKSILKRIFAVTASLCLLFVVLSAVAPADSFLGNYVARANSYYLEITTDGALLQNWNDTTQISSDDDWSNVVAIEGFSGAGLAPTPGTDPRTILADNPANTLNVAANQTDPATSTADGVAEFEIANPTIALKGSETAQAPNIVVHVNTLQGCEGKAVNISFKARDIDNSPNNAVSPLAVQYRIGGTGNYSNVNFAYISDTTTGPNQASFETTMSATLPNAATGVAKLDIRILTTNAVGADEWIGIDDINVNCGRPTRGASSISGVVEDAKGNGISQTKVSAFNTRTQETKFVYTNASGDFTLIGLPVGDLYIISIDHKRIRFEQSTQTVQLMEDVTGVRFVTNSIRW